MFHLFLVVVNYVYSVTWKRISTNHVEFNCTLACRTSIQACEVHLNNKTSNVSTNLVKLEFSTWATVNFYSLDPRQNYVYEVFARTNNVNGLMVQGVLPPLGKYIKTNCLFYCNMALADVKVTTDPISNSTSNCKLTELLNHSLDTTIKLMLHCVHCLAYSVL